MKPVTITKTLGMKGFDSDEYVGIIIDSYSEDLDETLSLTITGKRIALSGYTIAEDPENNKDWDKNEKASCIKIFRQEDIDTLFNYMSEEPFGKSMIELWGLKKEQFIHEDN